MKREDKRCDSVLNMELVAYISRMMSMYGDVSEALKEDLISDTCLSYPARKSGRNSNNKGENKSPHKREDFCSNKAYNHRYKNI